MKILTKLTPKQKKEIIETFEKKANKKDIRELANASIKRIGYKLILNEKEYFIESESEADEEIKEFVRQYLKDDISKLL